METGTQTQDQQPSRSTRFVWRTFAAILVFIAAVPLIANDRPIVAVYKGELLFPLIINYPDAKFDGFMDLPADYRDPNVREQLAKYGWAVWPPIRYSYDTININLPTPAPSPPTWLICRAGANMPPPPSCAGTDNNWLGTDDQGRDVLARLLYAIAICLAASVITGCGLALITALPFWLIARRKTGDSRQATWLTLHLLLPAYVFAVLAGLLIFDLSDAPLPPPRSAIPLVGEMITQAVQNSEAPWLRTGAVMGSAILIGVAFLVSCAWHRMSLYGPKMPASPHIGHR